jgi:hypothetical protein
VTDNVGGTGKDTVVVTVTPPAGSTFPATAVLDNFNRANGALGAPWENSVGFSVNANQMKPTGAYPNTCWNGAIFSANQEAFITFSTLASGGVEYILMLKMQGQFWYNGHIEVNYEPGSAAARVSTYAPTGGWVTRGSVPVTFASGDRYGARALANGNVTVYKNGTAVGTVSVSGWSFAANGGRIGMSFTTATASAFDDFGGGDAPAAIASAAATPASGDPAREEVALDAAPRVLELSSPYPNPSGGDVSIRLSLPAASDVGIAVLDLQGREVWRESARRYEAGRYTLRWSGRTAAGPARPGVYLMRVSAGETTFMRRVAVIR